MSSREPAFELYYMSRRPTYTLVPETLKSFSVFGMPTPTTMRTKLGMLLDDPGQSIAIVIFDAFRCSSTLLACFAAGLYGAVVMEKSVDSGTSIAVAQSLADRRKLPLTFGGELSGKPIPGAVVGNSPIEAWTHRDAIKGSLLHFQSTNFAKAFVQAVGEMRTDTRRADIYVASFANATATAAAVRAKIYNRVFLIGAGFFECAAIEDMVLGGAIAAHLGYAEATFDDDALAMLACHRGISLDALHHGWTARVLNRLSKLDDVRDAVNGLRFPADFVSAMAEQVLHVEIDGGIPVVRRLQSPHAEDDQRISEEDAQDAAPD